MRAINVQEECLAFDEGERTSLRERFERLLREAEKQVRRSERTLRNCVANQRTLIPYAHQAAEYDRRFLLALVRAGQALPALEGASASCRQPGDLNSEAA